MTFEPVLDVRHLYKGFTLHLRGGAELPVLRDLSFQVRRGECVALVGASGRGKSTLIKCLYGSYEADGGELLLHTDDGRIDLAQASPQRWLSLRRRCIAYVSQFLRVVPRVSALDVVAERVLDADPSLLDEHDERAQQAAVEAARARAAALLQRLKVPAALWALPPATFSGGEQQRINVARGFVEPARLLLLDEPTAALDADNRRIVVSLIREALARGSAVVGIFHDEEVRDAVASRRIGWEATHDR